MGKLKVPKLSNNGRVKIDTNRNGNFAKVPVHSNGMVKIDTNGYHSDSDSDVDKSYDDVLGSPLLDVLSISIRKTHKGSGNKLFDDDDDAKPCQVYGTVRVTDGRGNVFDIYNRDENEPETIFLEGNYCSLKGLSHHAITPSSVVSVEVDLRDSSRGGIQIASGVDYIEYTTDFLYNNSVFLTFFSDHGQSVVVFECVTYHCAVVGMPLFRLLKPHQKNDENIDHATFHVYGTILARCAKLSWKYFQNNAGELRGDIDLEYPTQSICIFDKPRDQPVEVEFGGSIGPLLRSLMVVPAHLSLVIDFNLVALGTHPQSFKGRVHVSPYHIYDHRTEVWGKYGHIEACVQWLHAYNFLALPGWKVTVPQKKVPLKQSQKALRPFWPLNKPPQPQMGFRMPMKRMEVFSVSFSHYDKEVFSHVYGEINVISYFYYPNIVIPLYKRERDCPEKLRIHDKMKSLVFPPFPLIGPHFVLEILLKDVDGSIICNGCFNWNETQLVQPMSWYDMPLCSVIRGDHGYAMVHYAMFSDSGHAKLKLLFFAESCPLFGANVSGSLLFDYDDFECSTFYDREYFKNEIFVMGRDNSAMVSPNCEIPLSKSVVSYPMFSAVSVKLDLKIAISDSSSLGHSIEEDLRGVVSFSTDGIGELREFVGRFCSVILLVETGKEVTLGSVQC